MNLLISKTKTTEERRAAKGWSAKTAFGARIAGADRIKHKRGSL